MEYTNHSNIPLPVALWLAHDTYNYNSNPLAYSATELLKPLRSTVLAKRVPPATKTDISAQIASHIGNAIHDAIEGTWLLETRERRALMENLGVPPGISERILINPSIEHDDGISVYTEKHFERSLDKFTITGTADFIQDGQLIDFKTTKCYSYIKQSSADKFIQQGSIYRWIAPDIITSDHLEICYIFLDWAAGRARWDKKYPKAQVIVQKYPLMSLTETETFIRQKISDILNHDPLPQSALPLCNQEELWQDDPVFKYYRDPAKTTKSTKNFDSAFAAQNHRDKIGKGVVLTVPGKAIHCKYCPAVTICEQAEQLVAQDLLDL